MPIDTPALGDRSYLVHDGTVALVIDPQRDIGRVLGLAAAPGVRITRVFETRLHNDYVTGGSLLYGSTGRPDPIRRITMCRAITCRKCGKTTWAGCGRHVSQVLAGVPASRRCPGHASDPAVSGSGWLRKIFGRGYPWSTTSRPRVP